MEWILASQQNLLHAVSLPVMVLDSEGVLLFANKTAIRWARQHRFSLEGDLRTHLMCADKKNQVLLKAQPRFRSGYWCKNKKSRHPIQYKIFKEAENYYVFIESIHQDKRLAQYDPLTGLPNRALFLKLLPQFISQAARAEKKLGILFIDLDHFKKVNDHLGHHAGDLLLKQVTQRFQQVIRRSDLLARQGGDEFIVAIESVNNRGIAVVAQRLLEAFSHHFELLGREIYISTSIGVAVYPDCALDIDTLLQCADTAMYHAKGVGRNNFQFYTEELNKEVKERIELENHLRKAIDNEELLLHYQPQIDLRTGKISHVEALLRWQSKEFGSVSPMEFIPVAEESGLINVLGEWVLRAACLQCRQWQLQNYFHPPIKMAVNISLHQLEHPDFLNMVTQALKHSGLDPEFLELELTESAVMHDPIRSIAVLNELHDLGISIAVDDFGTGYSSLAYLTSLPIDVIKIDRSFVRDIFKDPNDAIIVKTIIHLAHNLGITVVAEGVEEKTQSQFLMQYECDKLQGFLFCKPMAAQNFVEFSQSPGLSFPHFAASPYLTQMRRRSLQ